MLEHSFCYVIVGGGRAGASAVEGIRKLDDVGTILLIGQEEHLPYDRPPLSKKLWVGDKKVEDILAHDKEYYEKKEVQLLLGTQVVALDAGNKTVTDDSGEQYRFEKLLLATGGIPRHLSIPGGEMDGIFYYRYLDDYARLRRETTPGKSAVVIGGGFIGSEMAAALTMNGVQVTMIFPEPYLAQRVFPEGLGRAIQDLYRERGIKIMHDNKPAAFSRSGIKYYTRTESEQHYESDLVVVGIGITPAIELAREAGLQVENGVVVNEYLQTSHPDIYAAGDIALFPYQALGQAMRVEHWDNALKQGQWAGRNMAGAHEPLQDMPYFYSDLFEFGYEAVGQVDARLEILADWEKENDTGVIYYLQDDKVRGVMLCNVWGKLDAARELIRSGKKMSPRHLRGAIGK
jgi:3-phenylpropionate/trans-cinnamate dioxygenase ferredoxin reductase subunit